MSRPGKGNKAPIFCASPLPLPRPALPSPGPASCKFRFFPQPLSFQHNFRRRHRQPRRGGWDGRARAPAGPAGKARGTPRPQPPRVPGPPAGHRRPSRAFAPPPPRGAPRSPGAGRCRSPRVTKGLRASLPRVPLPRPPPSCLSAGSQVITNPWRGAEAEHLPERHGDDE